MVYNLKRILLTIVGLVRFRLRNRPCRPSAIPPPHDILVRNSRRPERHMALDGRSDFSRTHNWPASKSRQVEYGTTQEEAVEENMVVLLHAGPTGGTGHAPPHSSQGRRLRRPYAHGRRFRGSAALPRHHYYPHGLYPSPRRGSSAATGADVHRESEALSLYQSCSERTILGPGQVPGDASQEGSTRSSVMLFPKKLDQTDEVKRCDVELSDWITELPASCAYSNELLDGNSGSPLFVQRSLLHMVYFTTLSALHRPQVLPSAATSQPDSSRELQDLSRKKVREASREITRISQDLHTRGLRSTSPQPASPSCCPQSSSTY